MYTTLVPIQQPDLLVPLSVTLRTLELANLGCRRPAAHGTRNAAPRARLWEGGIGRAVPGEKLVR